MGVSRLVLDNAELWIGDGSAFHGHVSICDGVIESVARGRYAGHGVVHDLAGHALSPGLIDLMVLGGFGKSILRDDPIEVCRRYLNYGVTSCLFSGGMLPWEQIIALVDNVRGAMAKDTTDACCPLGLYLEGPFIQADRAGGALPGNALAPTPDRIKTVIDQFTDVVKIVNVSPGVERDVRAVRELREAQMIVSMAHSNAPADQVLACIDAGTSVLGHAWNNNQGLTGDSGVPHPTLEHVALTDERVKAVHLICDGTHIHPVLIKLVLRCRGIEALCIVTDCNQRAACADGPFTRDDGQMFYKQSGVCRRAADHALAGSATLLPDAFRKFIACTGLAPHQAIRSVTMNPAGSLGLDTHIGLVAAGRTADLVAWDRDLNITHVWRRGVACIAPADE